MAYYTLKSYKLRLEPIRIFESLSRQRHCFFLDSSLNTNYSSGRYSFLGIEPFYIFKTKNQDPFPKLREDIQRYKLSALRSRLPFLGGAVGYLAYDLGLSLEKKVKRLNKNDSGIPDCFFGFYNAITILDHRKRLLYIASTGFPEKKYHLAKLLAEANVKKIHRLISKTAEFKKSGHPRQSGALKLNSNFTQENYLSAIKKAKEYIRCGDIYQVNLSQRFEAKTSLSAFQIYKRLRQISPSCFSGYLDGGDFQILSSSPERFLRLEGSRVTTSPMKGTRPRSQNKSEDKKLKQELLGSAKDKAELVMIVDLERNDLGRVCDYESIGVDKLRQLEEYSTVFQTTASICGKLHKDKDRIDLLRACFPGGSVTGCPKIRAMEIIEELEPQRRSIYTGSLGYLSFSGDMDFNILIRTILKKDETISFGAGGGIVADSHPEDEYLETLVKARAMTKAIS